MSAIPIQSAPKHQAIEIIVESDGSTTVETRGFVGPACREASKFLEQALGTTTAERRTSEFHQTEQALLRQSERT